MLVTNCPQKNEGENQTLTILLTISPLGIAGPELLIISEAKWVAKKVLF